MPGLLTVPDFREIEADDKKNPRAHSLRAPGSCFYVHGLRALKPDHPEVVRLRELGYHPTQFGSRIWRSSYLLIHYLSELNLLSTDHVMELGCGWGLPAAYVQKRFGARVTAVDGDQQVFAFQQLISEINQVRVDLRHSTFADLSERELTGVNCLIGADICYSPGTTRDLEGLFQRFADQGGRDIILADSGRVPFYQLLDRLENHFTFSVTDVNIRLPTNTSGQVLHIRMRP